MTSRRTTYRPTAVSQEPEVEAQPPILVVDDDPALRRALTRILEAEGHRVIAIGSGTEALETIRAHRPSLVVLDYAMPGMDGEMVLRELRQHLAEDAPPAVLLTASGLQQSRAREIGAVLGLFKPFRVEELLDAVEEHRRQARRQAS